MRDNSRRGELKETFHAFKKRDRSGYNAFLNNTDRIKRRDMRASEEEMNELMSKLKSDVKKTVISENIKVSPKRQTLDNDQ